MTVFGPISGNISIKTTNKYTTYRVLYSNIYVHLSRLPIFLKPNDRCVKPMFVIFPFYENIFDNDLHHVAHVCISINMPLKLNVKFQRVY